MHDITVALQQMQEKIDALTARVAALEKKRGPIVIQGGGDPVPEEKK
jgi:hypothetical protein